MMMIHLFLPFLSSSSYIFLVTGDICYETVVYFLLLLVVCIFMWQVDSLPHRFLYLISSSPSSPFSPFIYPSIHFIQQLIHFFFFFTQFSSSTTTTPAHHHHQQHNLLLSVASQSELETSLPFLLMIIFFSFYTPPAFIFATLLFQLCFVVVGQWKMSPVTLSLPGSL